MGAPPRKGPSKPDADKHEADDKHPVGKAERHAEPFHNQPSDLDEKTHMELRLMHQEASAAMLFAKSIQWQSVGAALLIDAAIFAIAAFTAVGKTFADVLIISSVVLACGVIFVLLMYQFWQLNEINKMNEIEKNFSTLYARISKLKSRREGNFHRYTLLFFMIVAVVAGTLIANLGIQQALSAATR